MLRDVRQPHALHCFLPLAFAAFARRGAEAGPANAQAGNPARPTAGYHLHPTPLPL